MGHQQHLTGTCGLGLPGMVIDLEHTTGDQMKMNGLNLGIQGLFPSKAQHFMLDLQ